MLPIRSIRQRILLTFFPLLFVVVDAMGQSTVIHGTVTDSLTGEPLPYVHIAFPRSDQGTITDEEGNYRIRTSLRRDSIRISFLGYQDRIISIEGGKEQRIDVSLAPRGLELQGVEIRPDDRENPAHPIMRKVFSKKDSNAPGSVPYYEYDVYNKLNIGMGVRKELVNSCLLKPFRFVFENIDSSGAEPYLPIFVSESLSRIYYRKEPRSKKEYIEATHASGIENSSVTKYLGNMYQELEFYRNNVPIFNKSFKSPIADGGLAFYDYYLIDRDSSIEGVPCFRIRFKPRRENELTFYGELYVERTSFALKRLEANISEGANINYIRKMSIHQDFERFEGGHWMLTRNELDVEAAIRMPHNLRWQEFYAQKTTHYSDFILNEPRPDSIYTSTDDISIRNYGPGESDSTEKDAAYWKGKRPVALSENEKAVYEITDSIKEMPHYKVIRSLLRGYVELGPMEMGPLYSAYSFNAIEGNRFRIGGRTAQLLDGKMNLNAYGAYGTKDDAFKYGVRLRYFFERSPTWSYIGLSYQKDLEQLGQGQRVLENDNILNSTFRRDPANKLNGVEEFRFSYRKGWDLGISARLEGRRRTISPRGRLDYLKRGENGNVLEVEGITTSEISLKTHFGYKEKFYTTDYQRITLGSDHPVVDLNYSYGFEGLLGADYGYQKLIGRIRHNVRIGTPGTFEYRIEAGKYWGELPYPLLELHDGNETYFLSNGAFSLMNYYEFVSDEYLSLFLTHHFEGLFLDKVPLLRRLDLRTVISGKAVLGAFDEADREAMPLPDHLHTLKEAGPFLERPYTEASVGIENILNFIRVDAVWRLNYLQHSNITPFGVRATVQFGF